MLPTLPICPDCLRPIASMWTYEAGYMGALCTPASLCPTWSVVATYDYDQWAWKPNLRLLPGGAPHAHIDGKVCGG